MKYLKYIIVTVSIVICLLWYNQPKTNWEPIFVIVSLIFSLVVDFVEKKQQNQEIKDYKI